MAEEELSKAETLLENARMAEMTDRHTDMAEFMKELVIMSGEEVIEKTPRNLLSVAYKNLIGNKRSGWRVVKSLIEKYVKILADESGEERQRTLAKKQLAEKYLKKIVEEIKQICDEVVDLLDNYLIKNTKEDDPEQKTFFYKMKGDYYRYLAEVLKYEPGFDDVCKESEEAYEMASTTSKSALAPTNPVFLGNQLNYSVFQYEIKEDGKRACELAKEAFDTAIGELDGLQEDSYKDSTLIMQLLRDNLTLWNAEVNSDGKEEDKDE